MDAGLGYGKMVEKWEDDGTIMEKTWKIMEYDGFWMIFGQNCSCHFSEIPGFIAHGFGH